VLLVVCGALWFAQARAGAAPSPGDDTGPNAPLPSKGKARAPAGNAAAERVPALKPAEMKDFKVASVEKARGDEILKLAGPKFLKNAKAPVAIEVSFKAPLDTKPRAGGPMIVLNGVRLTGTTIVPDQPNTVVAFLPDKTSLKKENTVTVIWV